MRPIIPEVPVVIEQGPSGGFSPILTGTYDMGTSPLAGGNTDILQLRYRFPAGFDANDAVAGMYRPRVWIEDAIWMDKQAWIRKFVTPPASGPLTSAISGGTALERNVVETETFTKATYYDASDPLNPVLSALQVQFQTTATSQPYDSLQQDRSDPRLVLEFERQDVTQLDALNPVGESDHLWTFSQADVYVIHPINIGGTIYYHRHKIGFIADEDIEVSNFTNRVKFTKGKPHGTVVQFMSEIVAMFKFQLATTDPWIISKANVMSANVVNNRIKFYQQNKQRPIEYFTFSVEWNTSSGHRVSSIIPKGQVKFGAAMKPGDANIAKIEMEVEALVGPGRISMITDITQSQVQQIELSLGYRAA